MRPMAALTLFEQQSSCRACACRVAGHPLCVCYFVCWLKLLGSELCASIQESKSSGWVSLRQKPSALNHAGKHLTVALSALRCICWNHAMEPAWGS